MRKILLGIGLAALLVVYQNCSLDAKHMGAASNDFSSFGKACDAILKNAYMSTYYNVFRSGDATRNCIPCHASGGEAGPSRAFASADFNKAFEAFSTTGRTRVQANMLNPNHKPPHTGAQNQSVVDGAKAAWDAAEAAARACSGTGGEVITINKAAPANVYTTTPGDNAATAWPRISFDLDTELADTDAQNKVHMTITLEVRRFMDNTRQPPAAIGYQFRNPTVTVKTANGTTPTYRITGLSMNLNGSNYTYMTAYSLLDVVVNSTTGVNIAPGAAFAAAPTASLSVANTDQFAFRFTSILDADGQPVTPTPGGGGGGGGGNIPTRVTFADLNSANPTTGVFSRSCNNCHNANNRQGSLDLTNYAASVAVASTIRSRMNNAGNPMPPAGLLSNNDRAVVDVWVNGGAPQN
ncbi:MAG: hypothetical protein KF799_16200 [Bdellovibrionales bacterium]|nr:hypothetical protein [Bdellovibrionales bacterium]